MCIAAAGLLGGLVSAAGSLASASAQSAQQRAQAKFAEQQAEIERNRGALSAGRERLTGARAIGRSIASFGNSGVGLEGSPAAFLADVTSENELDADALRFDADRRAGRFRFDAELARSRARQARTQGFFSAASPIISSLSSAASSFARGQA